MKKIISIAVCLYSVLLMNSPAYSKGHHAVKMDKVSAQKSVDPMNCRYVPKTTRHQLRWTCRCDRDIQPYSTWAERCGLPK